MTAVLDTLAGELARTASALRGTVRAAADCISMASAIAEAEAVTKASSEFREAAQRIETYLAVLFNLRRGWAVDPGTLRIDIYESLDNVAAAAALHRAGFAAVTFHTHGPRRFLTCKCTTREATT